MKGEGVWIHGVVDDESTKGQMAHIGRNVFENVSGLENFSDVYRKQ